MSDFVTRANHQIGMANSLADELQIAGHDDVSFLDLLDCLACAGLALTPTEFGTEADGEADGVSLTSFAYIDTLRRMNA